MPLSHSTDFAVNDIFIDFGQAFKITKIENTSDSQGQPLTLVHYQNYFTLKNQQPMYCTIPLSQLTSTNKRKPIGPKAAHLLLKDLNSISSPASEENPIEFEDTLQQNDIYQTAFLVKTYWQIKHDSDLEFSSSKDELYQNGLNQISEELAVVLGTSIKDMRQKILHSLRKS